MVDIGCFLFAHFDTEHFKDIGVTHMVCDATNYLVE